MNDPNVDHFGALFNGTAAPDDTPVVEVTPVTPVMNRERDNSISKRISHYTRSREPGPTLIGMTTEIEPIVPIDPRDKMMTKRASFLGSDRMAF